VDLNKILLVTGGIFLYRLLFDQKGKEWMLFIGSLFGIFWLQSGTIIRHTDFWLPLGTITLVLISWAVITPKEKILTKDNLAPILVLFSFPAIISMMRFLSPQFLVTATIPPQLVLVIPVILAVTLFILLTFFFKNDKVSPFIQLFIILCLFVILKNPALQKIIYESILRLTGQSADIMQGKPINMAWLGFSYIAFRLIHTIRDFQNGRYLPVNLKNYFNYVIYLPAITAGPIDRIQNFEKEIGKKTEFWDDALNGGKRIIFGLVKKFVFADLLFIFAMNSSNIQLVKIASWLWVMLLAYALMIFLDFSGYTDIALGISSLMGISLPENFNRPYLSENLTMFWNRWHMSLTQWFRAYFYFPLTRFLKTKIQIQSQFLLNSFAQISTMVVIGLWHGITLNFVIWGLWHGFGLVLHSQWSAWIQKSHLMNPNEGISKNLIKLFSVFLTFIYVSLGWIWFAIPDFSSALLLFARLFGFVR
jgi:alginate O-acetyltransferase complex protein AlgI